MLAKQPFNLSLLFGVSTSSTTRASPPYRPYHLSDIRTEEIMCVSRSLLDLAPVRPVSHVASVHSIDAVTPARCHSETVPVSCSALLPVETLSSIVGECYMMFCM